MTNSKLFTSLSGLLIAAALFAGCSEEAAIEKTDPTPPAEEAPAKEEAPKEEAPKETEALKVGEAVQYEDAKVTLNKVRSAMGDEYTAPENAKYLIFDVVVENTGTEPLNVSSLMNFQLMDADGYMMDITIMPEMKGQLDGEVAPGRKLAGEIGFDVPESAFYEFSYSDPFASGAAIWKIDPATVTAE